MPLSQFVAIFLLEDVANIIVYTFDLKKFTIFLKIKKKNPKQVQKLVWPWPAHYFIDNLKFLFITNKYTVHINNLYSTTWI